MNPTANKASIPRVMVIKDDVNILFRTRRTWMIGSAALRSTVGNASKAARLTPKQRSERHELQPHSEANESASVSGAKAAANKTAPGRSKYWRVVLKVSRSTFCVPPNP